VGPIFGWLMEISAITLNQVAVPAQRSEIALRAERAEADSYQRA
jgi:hypothetical protein